MNIKQIERLVIFCMVVKIQSVQRVAEQLGIDRTTVTRSIQSLEQDLKIDLINNDRGKITLTHAGKRLYQKYASRMVILEQALGKQATESALTIQSSDIFCTAFVASAMIAEMPKMDIFQSGHHLKIHTYMLSDLRYNLQSILTRALQCDVVLIPTTVISTDFLQHFEMVGSFSERVCLAGFMDYVDTHEITRDNYKEHIHVLSQDLGKSLVGEPIFDHLEPKLWVENNQLLLEALPVYGGISFFSASVIQSLVNEGKMKHVLQRTRHMYSYSLLLSHRVKGETRKLLINLVQHMAKLYA